MIELTEIDAKILAFISHNGSSTMEQLKKQFPAVSSLEFRVKLLAKSDYERIRNISIPISNTAYLSQDHETKRDNNGFASVHYLGVYRLTTFGEKALQDYQQSRRSYKRELWLKNAWIPIIVSLVTSAIANCILPRLPQILQWAASTLSKIVS